MNITLSSDEIFNVSDEHFVKYAIEIFNYQYQHIAVYRQYADLLGILPERVQQLNQIPFLPIRFFKSHELSDRKVNNGDTKTIVFESSGTTGQVPSKHFVVDELLYQQSFMRCFEHFFGKVTNYCILGLLPSYLERGQSSLVYMVNHLIAQSKHSKSGFFLHDHQQLQSTLADLEKQQQATLVFGVTYALLDYAEEFAMPLKFTKIIETGGMKGRRVELLREDVHEQLKAAFCLSQIYSEYGMTELLSQAYSSALGIFQCPAWMKILVRDINDPFCISSVGKGAINIIDLANIHSCSFIATDDLGEIVEKDLFKVNGRIDASELRGCSLLTI